MKILSKSGRERVFAAAGAVLVGGAVFAAAPAHAADTTQAPPVIACLTFARNGVPIYETPTDGVRNGDGQHNQLFVSDPLTEAHAGGKLWIKGTDEATAVSGWVYYHNLVSATC